MPHEDDSIVVLVVYKNYARWAADYHNDYRRGNSHKVIMLKGQ